MESVNRRQAISGALGCLMVGLAPPIKKPEAKGSLPKPDHLAPPWKRRQLHINCNGTDFMAEWAQKNIAPYPAAHAEIREFKGTIDGRPVSPLAFQCQLQEHGWWCWQASLAAIHCVSLKFQGWPNIVESLVQQASDHPSHLIDTLT